MIRVACGLPNGRKFDTAACRRRSVAQSIIMSKAFLLSLTRRGSFLSASLLGLGSAVTSRGSVFVINIALAHSLSVHDYGIFSYSYVTALNLGLFLATGVSQAASHVLPKVTNKEALTRQLMAFLVAIFVTSLGAALSIFLFAGHISRSAFGTTEAIIEIQLGAGLLFAAAVLQGTQGFLYALHEHRLAAAYAIAPAATSAAAIWICMPIREPEVALLIFILANAAGAFLTICFLRLRYLRGIGWWTIDRAAIRLALNKAVPSILTTALGAPVHWMCMSMLAATAEGARELALFSVSFQWYVLITFIPAALGNLVLPFLSARDGHDWKDAARSRFRQTLVIAGLIAIFFGGITFVFSRNLLEVFYPISYLDAVHAVRALACAGVLCSISMIMQQRISSFGRFWINFKLTLVYSVVYVLCVYLFLKFNFGSVAPGLGMAVGYIVLIFLQIIVLLRSREG